MARHSEATLAAIKQAVDLVALVGESLTVHRAGSKFKALCPFHNDHHPSMEINPDRQSYKCWSCGAGGDVFDFVMNHERVEFPEALRMLADRAGITLDAADPAGGNGPSKRDLFEVTAWAEATFVDALAESPEARAYLADRKIGDDSAARFRLGYAPEGRDWLATRARRAGISPALLERVGLTVRSEGQSAAHERFRGRLIFPIRDPQGRVLGFGGRILPSVERTLAESGRRAAKYLNSPETLLFQKRRVLYGADLARPPARAEGWVAVVEGYTDVIAAHQVGLTNVVGTLGTALGDDHVTALRRMADRSVLVFDGDEAGQKAADRSLELFLGHEVDVRVLALPTEFDPCDFLLSRGAEPFRAMIGEAVDPLNFAIARAGAKFDLNSIEGTRQAAESVLAAFAKVPAVGNGTDLNFKVANGVEILAKRLSIPAADLRKRLHKLREPKKRPNPAPETPVLNDGGDELARTAPAPLPTIRPADLDPIDREIVQVVLDEPKVVAGLITRVTAHSLIDRPLREILQAAYDLYGEGIIPSFDRILTRVESPEVRDLAISLEKIVVDPNPTQIDHGVGSLSTVEWRLTNALKRFDERERKWRLRDVQAALAEIDKKEDPVGHQALERELYQLLLANGRAHRSHAS